MKKEESFGLQKQMNIAWDSSVISTAGEKQKNHKMSLDCKNAFDGNF